jgi:hypothetical protein
MHFSTEEDISIRHIAFLLGTSGIQDKRVTVEMIGVNSNSSQRSQSAPMGS